jgi:D-alanyl-D-alanine carboxypeptidase
VKKILLIIVAAAILAVVYGASYSYGMYQRLQATEVELASRVVAINQLEQKISEVQQENNDITATLSDEQKKNLDLEREKRRNERKIDTLTKLTTIDPELLKKYSKVYFLSENYIPPKLDNIDTKYLIDPAKPLQVLDDISKNLDDMLEDANRDEVQLRALSAYRSFEEQKSLKSGYKIQYGSGANTFSAEQGYSEHQLGTTIDFTTPVIKGAYTSFDTTTAYAWLEKNAYKYGFILSYPKGNTYYVYEPWHWRFVGENLADDLHDDNMHFYEMDQRKIDDYLIDIFD